MADENKVGIASAIPAIGIGMDIANAVGGWFGGNERQKNQYKYQRKLNEQMWMTLNRNYEEDINGIVDLTTYIDPSKYNNIFADTRLDAMNFWIQIKVDAKVVQKMSARQIPNL